MPKCFGRGGSNISHDFPEENSTLLIQPCFRGSAWRASFSPFPNRILRRNLWEPHFSLPFPALFPLLFAVWQIQPLFPDFWLHPAWCNSQETELSLGTEISKSTQWMVPLKQNKSNTHTHTPKQLPEAVTASLCHFRAICKCIFRSLQSTKSKAEKGTSRIILNGFLSLQAPRSLLCCPDFLREMQSSCATGETSIIASIHK